MLSCSQHACTQPRAPLTQALHAHTIHSAQLGAGIGYVSYSPVDIQPSTPARGRDSTLIHARQQGKGRPSTSSSAGGRPDVVAEVKEELQERDKRNQKAFEAWVQAKKKEGWGSINTEKAKRYACMCVCMRTSCDWVSRQHTQPHAHGTPVLCPLRLTGCCAHYRTCRQQRAQQLAEALKLEKELQVAQESYDKWQREKRRQVCTIMCIFVSGLPVGCCCPASEAKIASAIQCTWCALSARAHGHGPLNPFHCCSQHARTKS